MAETRVRAADGGARHDFLAGGGEMGARTRTFDWSKTPAGPIESWPQSLKTAVSICLGSRHPIVIWWQKQALTQFYNDGFISFLGVAKHPASLGQSARDSWSEIWHIIDPMLEGVFATGEATWSEDFLYVLNRNLPREEGYFTFSYSPIRDDTGAVEGIFCACSETTGRVIGERRLRTLRDLGQKVTVANTAEEACAIAAGILADNPHDIPFALLFLLDAEARHARLEGTSGLGAGTASAWQRIDMSEPDVQSETWPLRRVFDTGAAELVSDLARFGPLPGGPWPESPEAALVLPITALGQTRPTGFLVVGLSPRRIVDADYRSFFDLIAGHIGTAVTNARAYAEERRRAEALAQLDQAKTTFFSNVSHEFRTPLTLMLGPIEDLLIDGRAEMTPGQRAQLETAHRNSLRLLKLVNTLLDFSRIEAGRIEAVYEPIDLHTFTAELASNFRAACERAGLMLRVDCSPCPEPVYVDRDMWEKIVLNLLSNAFKFTFTGEIAVTLRPAGDHVELAVRDTGTGIPPGEIGHLFERFYRIKDARARTHEGTGIGLSLVQELVRLHGGSVSVKSALGEGSTFTVMIPLGQAHLPAERIGTRRTLASTTLGASPFVEEALRWLPDVDQAVPISRSAPDWRNAPTGAPPANRPRILWVDDNADMRDYVSRLLQAHWDVETVADGQAALDLATAAVPDLVLSDVMIPGLDGFALLRALRANPDTAAVPVILLSGRAGEEARVEGLEAGADDYVVKPFAARELLARVSTHLTLAQARREAIREAHEARTQAETADRAKDVFLAMLSHELRQPMNSIVGWVRMLRSGTMPAGAQQQALDSLDRNAGALTRLIDDMLDVSSIIAGKLDLRFEPIDVRQPIAAAVDVIRRTATEKTIELEVVLDPAVPLVLADADRLQQVVWNLLSNAVKFTPDGGRVSLCLRHTRSRVVVEVTDSGSGIRPEHLPRVFDRFTQVRDDRTKGIGGLGLGLAIVRHVVELHGGAVSAASEGEGRGSTFTVTLPSAPPAHEVN